MSFWTDIPSLSRADLRDLKKGIDASFREFSRNYGEGIEAFFDPLYFFLVKLEKLLIQRLGRLFLFSSVGLRIWAREVGNLLWDLCWLLLSSVILGCGKI